MNRHDLAHAIFRQIEGATEPEAILLTIDQWREIIAALRGEPNAAGQEPLTKSAGHDSVNGASKPGDEGTTPAPAALQPGREDRKDVYEQPRYIFRDKSPSIAPEPLPERVQQKITAILDYDYPEPDHPGTRRKQLEQLVRLAIECERARVLHIRRRHAVPWPEQDDERLDDPPARAGSGDQPEARMSKTPITDLAEYTVDVGSTGVMHCVPVEVAEELELKLVAATERVKRLERAIHYALSVGQIVGESKKRAREALAEGGSDDQG